MSESHEENEQSSDDPGESSRAGVPESLTKPRIENEPGAETPLPASLPPVQAPNAGFLVQLFLIPMIIVAIIVMVWVLFSWIAHMGTDPRDLVRDLQSLNKASWQKAFTLSDLLRDSDYPELKRDKELAKELAEVLKSELQAGNLDASRIRLRVFLCKCLGEFEIPVGVPELLEAARLERSAEEVDVRYAALESLAVLTENISPEQMQKESGVLALLKETCQEFSEDSTRRSVKGELRSAAAFTLGVIGGKEALEELDALLVDPYPNVRYNAALGMTRHGDLRSMDVLMAMLTADNPQVVAGEQSSTEKESKRLRVMVNAIRAVRRLLDYHPSDKLEVLKKQLETLAKSELPISVVLEAKETLAAF
jgi:hypothetical protein